MNDKAFAEWNEKIRIEIIRIRNEYITAKTTLEHPKFNSYHEGISVIREEFEELWEEIKGKRTAQNDYDIRKEAIQLGAMVLGFIVELTE